MNIPLLVVSSLFFLAGFWGLIIPAIPDLPLIWLGVLIYGLGTRFSEISLASVLLLGALSATTYLIDYLATMVGARKYGASRQGTIGALVGGIVGLVLLPPFGFIVGAVLGTILAEVYVVGRSREAALRASKGALIGLLGALVVKVVLAGIIISVFLRSIL